MDALPRGKRGVPCPALCCGEGGLPSPPCPIDFWPCPSPPREKNSFPVHPWCTRALHRKQVDWQLTQLRRQTTRRSASQLNVEPSLRRQGPHLTLKLPIASGLGNRLIPTEFGGICNLVYNFTLLIVCTPGN